MVRECYSGRERSPIAKENWKPMDPRKFGYEVSVRPNAHRPYRLWGSGEGTYEAARLGEEYTFASATFFRRETLLGNPHSLWRENRVAVVPLKKKKNDFLFMYLFTVV